MVICTVVKLNAYLAVPYKAPISSQDIEVHNGTLRTGVFVVCVTVEHTHWPPVFMTHPQHAVVHMPAW